MSEDAVEAAPAQAKLAASFSLLGNGTRLTILHRLRAPATIAELTGELGITRQAVTKQLDMLVDAGLVTTRESRRGAFKVTEYQADAGALFAFKEEVLGLALEPDDAWEVANPTRRGGDAQPTEAPGSRRWDGPGLLLLHGDRRGRWFPLDDATRGRAWSIGRDAANDIVLSYDPFVSARHAVLSREASAWTLTDLRSTNGTAVNLDRVPAGDRRMVAPGDVITIGRSLLLLRGG